MIKATVIIQIEDGNNVYKIGDYVRVLMKPFDPKRPKFANEYINYIKDIEEEYLNLGDKEWDFKLKIDEIDRIRLARDGENFNDNFNFDD